MEKSLAVESAILTSVVTRLSLAAELSELTQIVAEAARTLAGADGTTFVLRDRDQCYYADENAISPLWKGKRFPLEACISGWCMLNREVVTIEDIYVDSRIPHDAYRPTFVKSLCMVPIRPENPLGAIGSYWAAGYTPNESEIKVLQVLANSAAIALENLELRLAVKSHAIENTGLRERTRDLEIAMESMAHDLRGPLAVMTGLGEVVRMRTRNSIDSELVEHVRCIIETGHRTAGQIDRMLSLYRVTNGRLERQPIDLSVFANQIMDGYSAVLSGRSVRYRIDSGLLAFADATLMYMVLENLLSNALKYSAQKPETILHFGRSAEVNGNPTFFVKDNGSGFDQSLAEKLFQPFARMPNHAEYAGTGIGLVSVARIVELHGGKVWAEGVLNEGATFYFSLPTYGQI
ncbi:MAG TPA: ATP-binding protein [Bdellovibrionales bacterium]|jgi:signal transduction histidine kinase|nr:ATP-binding protein [Bdellovibrionales bacterium]